MINFILSVIGLIAFAAIFFTLGGIATTLAVIEKLAEGDDQRKLEICDKLKKFK